MIFFFVNVVGLHFTCQAKFKIELLPTCVVIVSVFNRLDHYFLWQFYFVECVLIYIKFSIGLTVKLCESSVFISSSGKGQFTCMHVHSCLDVWKRARKHTHNAYRTKGDTNKDAERERDRRLPKIKRDRCWIGDTMKTIANDPGIICFQHCKNKVFSIKLLAKCPECHTELSSDDAYKMMPFRLPYPFIKPHQYPCSIILRPTHGDFLNDYFNAMNLHIGLTTSTGTIIEFDQSGLRKTFGNQSDTSKWSQSLVVETVPEAWYEHWDDVLREIEHDNRTNEWTSTAYHEDLFNCYTFVLNFLQRLNYGTLSAAAQNRTTFCERYIVPRTTAAGKYISLYRKIRDHGFYIHHASSNPIHEGSD